MVLSGVQDRLAPLQSWLFPRRVFVQLQDLSVTMLALEGRRIRWLERVPLPEGLCVNGEPLLVEALGDLLGDLLVERGFAGARVRAVLPRAASAWRVIEWPNGLWPELPELLLLQEQETLRLPWRLDGGPDGADLRIEPLIGDPPRSLMVAVRRTVLEGWIEVFAQAGVALDALEPLPICLWRAAAALLNQGRHHGLLLQLEPGQSWLLAIEDAQPIGEWPMPAAQDAAGLAVALEHWRRSGLALADEQGPVPIWIVADGEQRIAGEHVAAELAQGSSFEPHGLDPLAMGWLESSGSAEVVQLNQADLAVLWGLAAAEMVR